MPLFEKIIEESGGVIPTADVTLQEKIRRQKMGEMDEAAAERVVQSERTKEVELAAREAEGRKRIAGAQTAILEGAMPQGAWSFMNELLKDRNPQAPMTVQDMLSVLEYSKSLQPGPSDQPPDGVYGVLTALIGQMGQGNKQITPIELIQAMQAMNPPTVQASAIEQMSGLANAFNAMKSAFGPAPSAPVDPGIAVQPTDSQGRPIGGAINLPIPALTELFKTNQDIRQSQERHQQQMGLLESLRKEIPRIVSAAERQIGKGAAPGGKPPKQGPGRGQDQPVQMPMVECPHCKIKFGIPEGIKDVLCPNPACPSNRAPSQSAEQSPGEAPPEGGRP